MRVYVELHYRTKGGLENTFGDLVEAENLDEGDAIARARLRADKRRHVAGIPFSRATPAIVTARAWPASSLPVTPPTEKDRGHDPD